MWWPIHVSLCPWCNSKLTSLVFQGNAVANKHLSSNLMLPTLPSILCWAPIAVVGFNSYRPSNNSTWLCSYFCSGLSFEWAEQQRLPLHWFLMSPRDCSGASQLTQELIIFFFLRQKLLVLLDMCGYCVLWLDSDCLWLSCFWTSLYSIFETVIPELWCPLNWNVVILMLKCSNTYCSSTKS